MVLHYSLVENDRQRLPAPLRRSATSGHFLKRYERLWLRRSRYPNSSGGSTAGDWKKATPGAGTFPSPKKQIVWWVEDTVPHEYRPYVEEGILEWNKAFEKIGFRNAISVRWQNERDEFDPEDINYCTFRWITTPMTFAMSNLRSNPITGEMIDGDVIFDASWIRFWKQNHALLVGSRRGSDDGGEMAGRRRDRRRRRDHQPDHGGPLRLRPAGVAAADAACPMAELVFGSRMN